MTVKSFVKNNKLTQASYEFLKKLPTLLADRQYFGMASAVESALSKVSDDPRHTSRKNVYQRLANIAGQIGHGKTANYPTFVINLDRDTERLQRFDKRAGQLGIHYIRIPAYDSVSIDFNFAPYADLIAKTFWGGATSIKRGTIGCYLSHARVWQKIYDDNIKYAIILEDDAYPICPFPATIDNFNLPADFDIALINDHTAAWLELDMRSLTNQHATYLIYSHHHLIERIYAQSGTIMATGAYGYVVSRTGVEKLLEMFHLSKICCGPDWAMSLHSMHPSFREVLLNKLPEDDQNGIAGLHISDVSLNSYVLMPAIVDHRDYGISHIDHNNLSKRISRAEIDG